MSIKVMNDIWDNCKMSGKERLVMLAIADNADEDRRQAWPSIATISRKTKIPRRTLFRCIKRCINAGELRIVKHGSHDGDSNLYEILTPRTERKGGSVRVAPVPSSGTPLVPVHGTPLVPSGGTLTVIEPSKNREVAKGEKALSPSREVMLDREYQRVLEEMSTISKTYGDHQTWRHADRLRWKVLVERKHELRKILGIHV